VGWQPENPTVRDGVDGPQIEMHGRFAAESTILSGIPAILGRRLAPKNYYINLKIFSVKFARIREFCTSRSNADTKKAVAGVGPRGFTSKGSLFDLSARILLELIPLSAARHNMD
jgi:hypothetical protein